MMARRIAGSTAEEKPPDRRRRGFDFEEIEDGVIEVPDVLGGMHTSTPRGEIPKNGAELIQNGRIRDDWCGRRGGLSEVIAKPNSNEVIGVSAFFPSGRSPWIVRVTPTTIHGANDSATWHSFSGDVPGTNTPFRTRFTQFIEHLYVATRTTKLLKLDFSGLTSSEIEQAPKARFVTTFANRVIAARTVNESSKIFWSGRLEPEIWDPTEDISAGFENFVADQSGPGDDITGIFGLENTLVILREQSIMQATRQPFARAPFRFERPIGDQGCDLPNTAVRVTTEGRSSIGGIIFADYQTRGVWFYRPGIRPKRISRPIEDELFENLTDKDEVYGAYDPFNQEYHLRVASDTIYVYSLRHQAWSKDNSPDVSAMGGFQTIGDITVIDDLTGVINDLSGVIDDLSQEVLHKPGILKGTSTGEVLAHDRSQLSDWDGSSFEFIFQPPNVGSLHRRRSFMEGLARGLVGAVSSNGEIITELSTDGSTWRQGLTHQYTADGSLQSISHKNKQVTGEDIFWRIRTSQTDLRLFTYYLRFLEKGRHR